MIIFGKTLTWQHHDIYFFYYRY